MLGSASPAFAVVNPLSAQNNRFGIHILNEADIDKAAELVNSQGGDWGYTTIVIQDNDKDREKWQKIFDKLSEKHLIPIVRIATHGEGQNWVKPSVGEAPAWASFLNSLTWVVKNKYIVLFNEPNHAKEWSGVISPSEYAEVLTTYAKALKAKDPKFFVLNAGFDASAPNGPSTKDEQNFLSGMLSHNPNVFNYLDGWVSHSYPNPGFSSSPANSGRGSVRTFDWELSVLRSLGVKKDLPVFITETGWDTKQVSQKLAANYYQQAFLEAWNDPRIIAITPFVLNYQAEPFSNFSWKEKDSFKSQYQTVQSLEKIAGNPERLEKMAIPDEWLSTLTTSTTYLQTFEIENVGQIVWTEEKYYLTIESTGVQNHLLPYAFKGIKPRDKQIIALSLIAPDEPGTYEVKVNLVKEGSILHTITKTVEVKLPAQAETENLEKPKPFWKKLNPLNLLSYLRSILLG